ncbi:MAG: hypothetical protein Q9N68_04410 [Gammaproteobacteria bacterium]|nr:hypothetical protein [Gammaproteobacteria bacterium]
MLYINQKQAKNLQNDQNRLVFVAKVSLITLLIAFFSLLTYIIIDYPNNKQSSLDYLYESISTTTWQSFALLILIGALFSLLSSLRLFGQKQLASYLFFPIYRISIILTIVAGITVFKEEISWIILFFLSIVFFITLFFLAKPKKREHKNHKKGLFIALLCAILASTTQILSAILLKSDQVLFNFNLGEGSQLTENISQISPILMVIGSNLINLIICSSLLFIRYSKTALLTIFQFDHPSRASGVYNFIAFFTLNAYLTTGDLSTIYPISALSIILPTLIMQLRGEEKPPSKRQILFYFASLIAILILAVLKAS